MASYEEASRCPKCKEVGRLANKRSIKNIRGATIHIFECHNEKCKWFNESGWMVQVNPDGSVPNPDVNRPKQFPQRPDRVDEVQRAAQKLLDDSIG